MSITRYSPSLGRPDVTPYAMMMPSIDGNWVSYEDYKQLQKEVEQLKSRLPAAVPPGKFHTTRP